MFVNPWTYYQSTIFTLDLIFSLSIYINILLLLEEEETKESRIDEMDPCPPD
jgi:hypothetical protein